MNLTDLLLRTWTVAQFWGTACIIVFLAYALVCIVKSVVKQLNKDRMA